jgi:hypothetical protein
LDGLRVTQEGHNVNLYIEEPEEAVTLLMDFAQGLGSGAGRGNAKGKGKGRDSGPTPLR